MSWERALHTFKQGVHDMFKERPDAVKWYPSAEPIIVKENESVVRDQVAIVGIDIRDENDKHLGRFVGYMTLYNDATPDELLAAMERRMGVEP